MMRQGDKETIFGGGAPAAITYQHPLILKNVLGATSGSFRVTPAPARSILAMHRGEVNGDVRDYTSSIKAQFSRRREIGTDEARDPDGAAQID